MPKPNLEATLYYDTLADHRGHAVRLFFRYDETAGLECVDCNHDIVVIDNEVVCACEVCESPDKHNIFAEGFCQECYEECRGESN